LHALSKLESPIIIWDRDLPSEDWRDVVHTLAALPQRPCVLLLSRVVDDYLWNEVVRVGGYDVLSKPLKEAEVVRVVRLAWSYWASTAPTTK
jgi:FixJ family two-component response regulator